MKVVVTGASGFVGRRFCDTLSRSNLDPEPIAGRSAGGLDVTDVSGWSAVLAGAEVVTHLAALAHVSTAGIAKAPDAFFRVNVDGTIKVARAAVQAGVRRFVFVSSIGVLGVTSGERIWTEKDIPAPAEPYALTKWEAEQALRRLQGETGLDVVIVRPTLVYGPGVKGNFDRLLRLIALGTPLPFGSINNSRSFLGVENLCSLLLACVTSPAATNGMFLAADGEDVSTPQLLALLAAAMHKRARVCRFPPWLLRMGAALTGYGNDYEKLVGSLRVDPSHARRSLGWIPQVPLRAGLEEMVSHFLLKKK